MCFRTEWYEVQARSTQRNTPPEMSFRADFLQTMPEGGHTYRKRWLRKKLLVLEKIRLCQTSRGGALSCVSCSVHFLLRTPLLLLLCHVACGTWHPLSKSLGQTTLPNAASFAGIVCRHNGVVRVVLLVHSRQQQQQYSICPPVTCVISPRQHQQKRQQQQQQ